MLLEKFCHPHTILKHPYGKRLESSSSMVQDLCVRDIQKLVTLLTDSVVQVSVLTYHKPLIKTSNFLNCSFFVHCIAVRKRDDIMLFCGVFGLSRTSRPQERFLGISHHPAKYRVSVKDQVRASKTHNIIWRSLHFMGLLLGAGEYIIVGKNPLIPDLSILNLINLTIIMVFLVSPIEEMIFRSVLQTRLEIVLGSREALIVTSILFGLMHSGYGSIYEIFYITLVGAVIGYLFYGTRSLPLVALIHVLVEKPIADTTENADLMIAASQKAGKILMVGHIERFNPAVIKLKEIIDSGILGKIVSISTKRVGPYNPRIRDVGVILDIGVHELSLLAASCFPSFGFLHACSGRFLFSRLSPSAAADEFHWRFDFTGILPESLKSLHRGHSSVPC